MTRRGFFSIIMGIVAAVYVPSMPMDFEEAMPEPVVSADGGCLVPKELTQELQDWADAACLRFAAQEDRILFT